MAAAARGRFRVRGLNRERMRSLIAIPKEAWRNRYLLEQMTRREIAGRYRGSWLGLVWSLVTPLVMLALYALVFGVFLKARWSQTAPDGGTLAAASFTDFALILFSGLLLHGFLAECLGRAPSLVTSNANLVQKVVFPLESLAWSTAGTALFHTLTGLAVLLVMLVVARGLPPTALLLPVVLLPLLPMALGLVWLISAVGVFFRDIAQTMQPITTILLFLSPILFPADLLPEALRSALILNPLTVPVEQVRAVLIWGNLPDWNALGAYTLVAVLIAAVGRSVFERCREGFADAL